MSCLLHYNIFKRKIILFQAWKLELINSSKESNLQTLKCGLTFSWSMDTFYNHQNCVSLCVCVSAMFSHVWLFVTPGTVAHQAPLSMGFSRKEYWNGLPSPSPGDLLEPWVKSTSLALISRFFTTTPQGSPLRFLRGRIFSEVGTTQWWELSEAAVQRKLLAGRRGHRVPEWQCNLKKKWMQICLTSTFFSLLK